MVLFNRFSNTIASLALAVSVSPVCQFHTAAQNIYIRNSNVTADLCKKVRGKIFIDGGVSKIVYRASPDDEDKLELEIANAEFDLLVLPTNCLSADVPYVDLANGKRYYNPTNIKVRQSLPVELLRKLQR